MDTMKGLIIALVIVVVLVCFLVWLFLYIKKKIRQKIIDTGVGLIKDTAGKYLSEDVVNKVSGVTDFTAEALKKNGTAGLAAAVTKKGIEVAKDDKTIDIGVDIIGKASGKFLDEDAASKVNSVTNFVAEAFKKGGTAGLTAEVTKKGLEALKDKIEDKK